MAFQHTIKPGECMSTIAATHGFLKWETIYNHPNNAKFREDYPDPSCLAPGKTVFIPDKKKAKAKAAGRGKVTFVAKKPELYLIVMLIDPEKKPLSGIPYTLTVGAQQYSGKTVSGHIEHPITIDDKEGELSIQPYEKCPDWIVTCKFQIGHLDTVETVPGHQQRMSHKQNHTGPPDGDAGAATTAATFRLQIENNMQPDGKVSKKNEALLKA